MLVSERITMPEGTTRGVLIGIGRPPAPQSDRTGRRRGNVMTLQAVCRCPAE
jgi:hypothetical protein